MLKALLSLLAVLGFIAASDGQSLAEANQLALSHARASQVLAQADLADLGVDHSYTDEKLGVTYVYLQQRIGQVPVEGAVASLAIKGGEVFSFRQNFVAGLAVRTTSVVARVDDRQAVQAAATSVGYDGALKLRPVNAGVLARGQRHFEAAESFVSSPILVADVFALDDVSGELRRAITVDLDQRRGDYMHVTIDAATGAVLKAESYTHHCQFETGFGGRATTAVSPEGPWVPTDEAFCEGAAYAKTESPAAANAYDFFTPSARDGSSYRVYAWPAESPTHGPQTLVTSPADSLASPFGWHDTDGKVGPEFTITRGNNAHAYLDALDSNRVLAAYPEPDGGQDLRFDIAYDHAREPIAQSAATTINLFYAVNKLHDFAFHNGFTEAAGNFQQTNYTGQGRGGDYVLAESQDGSLTNTTRNGPVGGYLNNANFSTPIDGGNGRMQMYLWNANNIGAPITVTAPANLAGRTYGEIGLPSADSWPTARVTQSTNVTAGVVVAKDDVANASFLDGCEPLANAAEVKGRIALVDRGSCNFSLKALNAQNAGAVGVIICNFEDAVINMAAGSPAEGGAVKIPTVMFTRAGCNRLLADAAAHPDLRLTIRQGATAPTTYVAGSLDNGIVAHEYGHGISTRLTGGPNVRCLSNAEQMGEGWSDFFSLVTSVRPGDRPDQPRGIGTFAERQPTDGPGIRPFPYTRDMNRNPVTYADVADVNRFSAPHGTGSIWASMLWDLHWDLVDVYGFGADLNYDTLGNNKAIQLVMTGLKLQPCSPGFVDGRDAILAADELLYGGRHRQLIWRTFARRGLGAFASQGSSNNRSDGVPDFNVPLDFANRTFFTKSVTETIDAGGEVSVALLLANWIDSVKVLPTVSIADVLPQGATLVAGSVSRAFRQNGSVLSFDLADVAKGDSVAISYRYSAPGAASKLHWYEPVADGFDLDPWAQYNLTTNALTNFKIVEEGYRDGASWRFDVVDTVTRPVLEMFDDYEFEVRGDRPMFSFFHKYGIVAGTEGAVVQVWDKDTQVWETLPNSAFVRNGYVTQLDYGVFTIPLLDGYVNTVADWQQVLIDLSAYSGKTIRLRWRFGRRQSAPKPLGKGWSLDEFAQIDAVTYNTAATLKIGTRSQEVKAPGVGTYVKHDNTIVSTRAVSAAARLTAYPNPTTQDLHLVFEQVGGSGIVEVMSVTGQRVGAQAIAAGERQVTVDLGALAAGVYVVRVERNAEASVVRVVKR